MIRTIWPLRFLFRSSVVVSMASLVLLALALTGIAMAQNPVPLINQPLVPDAAKPGGAGFTLTVNGTGFVSGAVLHWNGSARPTTFVSMSQLTATIPASDIAKSGTASVTVVNPLPGGGTSNVGFFEVSYRSSSIATSSVAHFGNGNTTIFAAAGDFNNDGKLDLAVADIGANNVMILLGNGDGTFQTGRNYPTGTEPISLAVGDVNDDGKLDLIVANSSSANVSVLLGKGDGTFLPAVNYFVGTGPQSVAIGDFNGDGKLDLAVANLGSGDVSILLGNGDGTFKSAVSYALATAPQSVAVGDFNGDGRLDLALALGNAGTGTEVSVLLGNGDGTFQNPVNYATGLGPFSVVVGDFNHDGKLDLATANAYVNTVSVLLGNGDGTFQTHVDYNTDGFPVAVGVADLNADGNLDLIVANQDSSDMGVLLGNGDGTFEKAVEYDLSTVGNPDSPESVAIGDFNRDGRLDIATNSYGSGQAGILLQVSTVSLSKTSLTFVDQLVGTTSAFQTSTLTNTSGLTLTISSIAITGSNSGDFSETNNCGSSLPPGAHCTISVTFKPTAIGMRNASVTITDNASGNPQSVALSGTGVISGPNATLSPTSLTFATQLVGTTSTALPVTLSNYGTMTLSITGISLTGADPSDFAQTNTCGSALVPGGSCTVSVTFKPTQLGPRTATLAVADNAPGSPQTVGLSGISTVVKLNPTSLSFHCHNFPQETCPPLPQTTTLTNAAMTTLTISSITITGQYFSQSNNCPQALGPHQYCTITVRFDPRLFGTFNGAVSVSDNGGGSPQAVALSGSNTKRGMSLAARSAISTIQTATVPGPTGRNPVGTQVMDLVDSNRSDPFLANGSKRELMVRFWYPASISQGCDRAEYTSPAVWSYFSQLAAIPLPEVRTNSCLDAPIAQGPHPVVVFTHGYTGTFTDYTFLFEDLASRGYVVAAVDHTYEATAVEFPDGRLAKSMFGSHLAENTWRRDEQSLSLALAVRLKDLKFIVDELARLNGEASGPFADRLDLQKVAVAGHSLGGLTALLSLNQDPRFKAGVLLDATVPDGSATLSETPVLVLAMGRPQWAAEECRLWSDRRGPRLAVNFPGAEHVTPTDAVWLAKGAIKTGAMGPEKTISAVRDYVAAFLDVNLRGKPVDPRLTGPSPDYPDVTVTTKDQPLCHQR